MSTEKAKKVKIDFLGGMTDNFGQFDIKNQFRTYLPF